MCLSEQLIKSINSLLALDEVGARRTISFSGGKRHVKMKCPPGYKLINGSCQRMKASEVLSRRRGAKRSARVRKSHQSQTNRKRALTLRRRHSAGF